MTHSKLLEKIQNRSVRSAVVGLGYVGLPLAVEFARAGYHCIGIDLDETKVRSVQDGHSYIDDVRTSDLAALRETGRLEASASFDVLHDVDTINICVPTPLRKTRDPDMSFVISATQEIAVRLRPGMLVILESTTYPGTTEELVLPILEKSGLRGGSDFFLAFSPERVDPGNANFTTSTIPKVVGGLTPTCTRLATELYRAAIATVVPVSSTRVAEMVKLLENTFRAVNIAMVNEMALMCTRLGIDVWEVVDAAASKPFGFMPFYPGPGLGGHCIPIDPFYLSWKAKESGLEARFIELAGAINGSMPEHVVSLVSDALNDIAMPISGARILVAGVAYKRNVDDIRESPALDIMTALHRRGAVLSYADPHVPRLSASAWPGGLELIHTNVDEARRGEYDCVLIVTDHAAFDYDRLQGLGRVVVDTRAAIEKPGAHVTRLGAAGATGRVERGVAPEVKVS